MANRDEIEAAGLVWPAGEPLPATYAVPVLPCPSCRRVLLDDLSKAVTVRATTARLVYLECHACRARWKLPTGA